MNKIIEKDFEFLANKFKFKNELKNKTILITGGTGLIGSLTIKFLSFINEKFNLNLKIIGMARNKEKIAAMGFAPMVDWIVQDMKDDISLSSNVDFIIHCASPTQSKYMVEHPVELIKDTVIGTAKLLDFAKSNGCKSFVFLSSLEVYGQNLKEQIIDEDFNGYINNLSVRSSYPEAKRLIECLCCSYKQEYGLSVKIARLTQTFGAGVDYVDNRVFMLFAKSVLNNEDIILKTDGKLKRPYVYTMDAINAIFYILFKGEDARAYNVANPNNYISVKDFAQFAINNFNNNLHLRIEKQQNTPFSPETKLNLSVEKLKKLGWLPYFDLKQSFKNLLDYLSCEYPHLMM